MKEKSLETIDRRLLRGLYVKNLKDFDEELEDQSHNVTLLARLKKNLLHPETFTEPSPRKTNNGSMDESYMSSDAVLPDGINHLIKKDEQSYSSERQLMLKPQKISYADREKMNNRGNKHLKRQSVMVDKGNDYSGGQRQLHRESSDDSIDDTLNEIASNTFNPNLFKEVVTA